MCFFNKLLNVAADPTPLKARLGSIAPYIAANSVMVSHRSLVEFSYKSDVLNQ